jgi:hypothetical protein
MRTLAVIAVLSSAMALAQGTEAPAEEVAPKGPEATGPDADAAKELVTKYLNAVKAKKWAEAKKLVHPETLKSIAERKKRLGKEDHPMAPQTYEKTEFYLKDFKVKGATKGTLGTLIVETAEDNYQVEVKGVAESEMATYLVGKKDGKWWVVDKKRGETFNNSSIKLGYKGYFDKLEEPKPE